MKLYELLREMRIASYRETGVQPTKIVLGIPIYMELLKEMQPLFRHPTGGKETFDGLEIVYGIGLFGERLPDTMIAVV